MNYNNKTFDCGSDVNHTVISGSQVCNFIRDCPQDEDELHCGKWNNVNSLYIQTSTVYTFKRQQFKHSNVNSLYIQTSTAYTFKRQQSIHSNVNSLYIQTSTAYTFKCQQLIHSTVYIFNSLNIQTSIIYTFKLFYLKEVNTIGF